MDNIQFLEQYIRPIYVSSTNIISPLITINLDKMYAYISTFINSVNYISLTRSEILIKLGSFMKIMFIGFMTILFIVKELLLELITNFNINKIVYIIAIYNLIMLIVLEKHRRKLSELSERTNAIDIDNINKSINYLKKTDKLRDDLYETWISDIKLYYQNTQEKISTLKKKVNKLQNELKKYE